ncbi:DUF4397 domain-containing protein [Pseudonocardia sp. McavD-2-B]|uniref:DUF4397 domain-containing protein n=1 Tax=Pseudonocardia sp. McavD-2-B TaxID=2954499 RepID=UPI0020986284|nr:DUF4397 domain-containing protein [Pseudonocardia sp. McavD-2-B]MCO7191469.1 DUF4397 domain-containing protein [Pseudonocardia sp. McavD-2-B]
MDEGSGTSTTRWGAALGAVVISGGVLLAGAPVAMAQETGSVRVVHGIPGQPVDVYVDGERALDDFEPGTVAGPVDLPAGAREVAVFPADAPDNSGEALLQGSADVAGGASATLVARLDAQGSPTLTPFEDDGSPVAAGQARLVVRHTAAAPAVDVLAGGQPVVEGVTNPQEQRWKQLLARCRRRSLRPAPRNRSSARRNFRWPKGPRPSSMRSARSRRAHSTW